MKTKTFFLLILLLTFALAACSAGGEQNAPPTLSATPADTAGAPTAPANSAGTSTEWADLDLAGKLVYMVSLPPENRTAIAQLDLQTGMETILFEAPAGAFLTSFTMSPDSRILILSYQPPLDAGSTAFGYSGLYWLPADGSAEPAIFLLDEDSQEAFFAPVWSAGGDYLYYALYRRIEADEGLPFVYEVERASYPDGERERLAEQALWPSPSPDGRQLAYLSFIPESEDNELFVADAAGSNPVPALAPGAFPAVDAHFFSPDGSHIYFSAVTEGAAEGLSWLDRLMGVRLAEAHDLPSDWWRVPVAGGEPEKLTDIGEVALYGDFSPDGRTIGFLSASGLSVMNPDGSGLTRLVERDNAFGVLQWIP